MTLKIEPIRARVRLSGELRSGQLAQVKAEIKCGRSQVVLDLEELVQIDLEGIRFLNTCEARGIEVLHSRPYIRDWMARERSQEQVSMQNSKRRRMSTGKRHRDHT